MQRDGNEKRYGGGARARSSSGSTGRFRIRNEGQGPTAMWIVQRLASFRYLPKISGNEGRREMVVYQGNKQVPTLLEERTRAGQLLLRGQVFLLRTTPYLVTPLEGR